MQRETLALSLPGILWSAGCTRGEGELGGVGCSQLLAVRTWQVDVFPSCQAQKGRDIKEIEDAIVRGLVIYQFLLREVPATYFQVCKS